MIDCSQLVNKQQTLRQFGKTLVYHGYISNDSFALNQEGELLWISQANSQVLQKFNGQFENDRIHGEGQLIFRDEYGGFAEYQGMLQNNQFEGQGTLKLSNGDIYEGSFQNSLYNGIGKIVFGNQRFTYSGQFINGLFNGEGTLTIVGQMQVTSRFQSGLIDITSNAQVQFYNGDSYEGQINRKYQMHGNGRYQKVLDDGQKYVLTGIFLNGKPTQNISKILIS
ncbi:hypothetical protein FGO68_gene7791 [Halteria grandinella]|uniref:MORN motif-containing protein n=1 Tax=Halteria grandinella TaxID=5974 RepID=A0A8J8NYL0_HALGN|nr:hypothetical protein FGO68_gene7791 [Halteria grandinella]